MIISPQTWKKVDNNHEKLSESQQLEIAAALTLNLEANKAMNKRNNLEANKEERAQINK